METALTIFNFQDKEVRIQMIEDKPWWVANDVCAILGYSNERDAIKRHCRQGGVVKYDTPTSSGIQPLTYINEGNIYRLIAKSKLPAAEIFETWAFDEILPSVCKTGSYSISPVNPMNDLAIHTNSMARTVDAFMSAATGRIIELNQIVDQQDNRLAQVEERQKQIDPQEIERRMRFLDDCKNRLVNSTKDKPQAVTHPKYWQELKKLIGINSFQNRAALTVEMMEKCMAYAQEWCETRGVNPPSLFDTGVTA